MHQKKINIDSKALNDFISEDCLWTYNEASKFLKRGKGTLRIDVMKRRIPFIKIRGSVRFSPAAIKEWLKGKSVTPEK